jgi:hypothetical protein
MTGFNCFCERSLWVQFRRMTYTTQTTSQSFWRSHLLKDQRSCLLLTAVQF